MSKTRIQQSQLNGSLPSSISSASTLGSGMAAGHASILDDLNDLRTLILDIKSDGPGKDWYDGAVQNLGMIYGMVHAGSGATAADATFQGKVDMTAGKVTTGDLEVQASTLELGVGATLKIDDLANAGQILFPDASGTVTQSSALVYSVAANKLNFGPDAAYISTADGSASLANGAATVGADGEFKVLAAGAGGAMSVKHDLKADGSADLAAGAFAVGNDGNLNIASNMFKVSAAGLVEAASDLKINTDKFVVTASDGSVSAAAGLMAIGSDGAVSVLAAGPGGSVMKNKLYADGKADLAAGQFAVDALGGVAIATDKFTVDAASGNVLMAGHLTVQGDEIYDSAGNKVLSFGSVGSPTGVADSVIVENNLQVKGDLLVNGGTTSVQTDNLIVKDAFGHFAVGATGGQDQGIVLHSGASTSIILGQNGTDGEFILAAKDVSSSVDGDNAIDLAGSDLVSAWMLGLKLAAAQGDAAKADVAWVPAAAGPVAAAAYLKLASTADIQVNASADMTLSANGNSVGLMSSAEYTAFDSNFAATSIVGALNELYAAGAGGAFTNTFAGSAAVAGAGGGAKTLDFSSLATYASTPAASKVDVYLNGVKMAHGYDITSMTGSSVTFDAGILIESDDVIEVVLRGASPA